MRFFLAAAVDVFYGKVVADDKLADFFKGITIETLKEHQRKFLRMAFTTIPKSINVEEFMYDKHKRLFLEGLSEAHFDLVAGHFVATLEQLGVPEDQIKEATDIVLPLRPIFEQGAAKAKKGAEEEKEEETRTLLKRLGGEAALEAAVDIFYEKLMADADLSPFFEGRDMEQLKHHQRLFMTIAFTKIPDTLDVNKFMFDKHEKLFLMGLNAQHFDAVAGHFIATLDGMGVEQKLIDEAVGIIAPLRPIFEEGAAKAKRREEDTKDEGELQAHLLERIGGESALKAAVNEFYTRLVVDKDLERFFVGVPLDVLKSHQEKFMRLAFTNSVPEDMDVAAHMKTKHYRLFAMGLDETHFDKVASHFVETLQHLGVDQTLIGEAVGAIGPLRQVFEKGLQK
jgi:hemoglobin